MQGLESQSAREPIATPVARFKLLVASVLYRHRVRIDSLFPSYTFESCQHTPVVILVALHGETALLSPSARVKPT